MRNMVEHGQTSGSSDTTVLSGCSSSSRFTRWISVPTPMTAPAGASSTARMMKSVDPTSSAISTTSWAHSGWMTTMPAGVLGPEGVDVLGSEALVDRAVALPQQQGGVFDVGVVEAAQLEQRVPHPHVARAPAELEAGVAAEVLVGEEQDLVALGHAGRRPGRAPR